MAATVLVASLIFLLKSYVDIYSIDININKSLQIISITFKPHYISTNELNKNLRLGLFIDHIELKIPTYSAKVWIAVLIDFLNSQEPKLQ